MSRRRSVSILLFRRVWLVDDTRPPSESFLFFFDRVVVVCVCVCVSGVSAIGAG